MIQADLFAAPLPISGLAARDGLVTPEEERALIERIDTTSLTPFQFQGWTGKRLTTSYGWHYDFDRAAMAQTEPMPPWLLEVRARAATLAGLPAELFVKSLLIRYDPGAGIGWHRDRPVFEHVIGLSLGADAVMRFRRRRADGFARASLPLSARGAYLLTGEARHDWEHSIAPMDVTRHSITFRSLAVR